MHEWSITEELLDRVCTQAKENQISNVTKVEVEMGKDGHDTVIIGEVVAEPKGGGGNENQSGRHQDS